MVGEGSSVFYHPTHLFFTPGLLWGRCCGSTDGAPAPGQRQGSAGSPLCFASLFYPKKLWEIGKNLELGMVVLPGGFTLRVGDEKKPSVVAQEPCVVTRVCCPVIHVPISLAHPGGAPRHRDSGGGAHLLCIQGKAAGTTPGCGPGSFLTSQRDRRRGAVPVLCVHTRNQVGINSSHLSHVSLCPYVKLLRRSRV